MSAARSGLRVRGLESTFAGPFDLDLGHGECVALRGPSGAGKSVVLRMLADLDPNTGDVHLDGQSRESFDAPAWRGRVIYQPAESAWWETTAGAHFDASQSRWAVAQLPRLGLGVETLSAPVERLSTGERQRLALLRSLSRKPQVLLLDEPTSALDASAVRALEDLLREHLAGGLAIVLVTHSQEQAERLADRVVTIIRKAPAA